MIIPPGHTEASVLEAVEKAVRLSAKDFVFGYFSLEDICQEARRMALQALPRYDPARELAPFLYRHVRNRLCNFKRDNLRRNEPACKGCADGKPCRKACEAGLRHCKAHDAWVARNDRKANLLRPQGLDHVPDTKFSGREAAPQKEAELRELRERIDGALPVALRATYLMMLAGEPVAHRAKAEVEGFLRSLFAEEGQS